MNRRRCHRRHLPLALTAVVALRAAAAAVLSLGPGGSSLDAADPAPASSPRARLEMWLDWKANAQFAGLIVAQAKGWYAQAGLDVTIHPNGEAENVDVAAAVAADDHALGSLEGRGVVAARGRGAPLRAVATMFQVTPFALICRGSSGIRGPADLAGKIVGIRQPDDRRLLEAACDHAGLRGPAAYRTRPVGFALAEFTAGEVDAVLGYLVDEVVQLRRRGQAVQVLPLHEHGWTEYAQVIVANERLLRTDAGVVRRFLAVTFRGWDAAVADPAAAARLVVGPDAPASVAAEQEASLRAVAPLLTAESPRLGSMRRETWVHSLGLLRKYGLTDARVGVDEVADLTFVP